MTLLMTNIHQINLKFQSYPFWSCSAFTVTLGVLMTHNWQNWKSRFPSCPCHEIYRHNAFHLKSSNYTYKNYHFCENVKFAANFVKIFIKVQIWKSFCTHVTHMIMISHTTFSFYLRGYCTSGPHFRRFCIFSQKIKQLVDKNNLRTWLEMFQGSKKSQFHFSRDHSCEVNVNSAWKSIFSMFWTINQ